MLCAMDTFSWTACVLHCNNCMIVRKIYLKSDLSLEGSQSVP